MPRRTKKDKRVYLNLNTYRNLHYRLNNEAKRKYKVTVSALVDGMELPGNPPYRITYTLYPASRRTIDVSNVCCIVDKFFCDALVEIGMLPDDNVQYVPEVVYRFGHVDKDNPRVNVEIESIT